MNKLLILVLVLCGLHTFGQSIQATTADEIHWVSFEEAEQMNQKERKKFFVFYYTDWCGYCKKMDKEVFTDANVINTLNNEYYAIRFNAEQKDPVTFDGNVYEFDASRGRRGMHEIANEMLLGQKVMPTTVILDNNKETLRRLQGLQPTELFGMFLTYMAEDAYLDQDWFEYSGQN